MVKHRPLMYKKKCENTFEILCSERTFLMDLYIYMYMVYFMCASTPSVIHQLLLNYTHSKDMVGKYVCAEIRYANLPTL